MHCSKLNSALLVYSLTSFGPQRKKTCLRGFANNTGADQPAHPHSLISPFVIRFLESVIPKRITSKFSLFNLVAEETGFEPCFVGNPEDRFVSQ